MSWINRLTGRKATNAGFDSPLLPDQSVAIIGDVHGRDDLLVNLMDLLAEEELDRWIFVGDYVDRGPSSAAVLTRLKMMSMEHDSMTCLMGNHERMLLNFLENPAEKGPMWLRYGGLQTLQSFGLDGVDEHSNPDEMLIVRDAFHAALEGMETWIAGLDQTAHSGNLWVVHGAADPDVAMPDQTERALLWGHRAFLKKPRQDGQWVVHGHTIVDQPTAQQGRIAVDTGAHETGVLTAAIVRPDAPVRFVST